MTDPGNTLVGRKSRTEEQPGVLKGDMEILGEFNKLQAVH